MYVRTTKSSSLLIYIMNSWYYIIAMYVATYVPNLSGYLNDN